MALSLNHFSIRTVDMDASRVFYETVLGLTVGPRPDFPFPGIWMYNGDHALIANAMVHIIGIDKDNPNGLSDYLGHIDSTKLHGSGAVDHIALMASGLVDMLAHLKALKLTCRARTVPSIGLHQLFLEDPSGVVVELNYPAHEVADLAAAAQGVAA